MLTTSSPAGTPPITGPTARRGHRGAGRARRALLGTTRAKLLASTVLVASAAGAAGLGTFGTFTSTTSASESASTGTVVLGLGADGSIDNRLSVAATGLVPGDSAQRVVKLLNGGTQNLSAITLTTTATPVSLLTTDPNGLTVKIDKCSTAWTEAGVAPAYTYTCGGTTTTVLAQQSVVGSNLALSGLSALSAGASDYLRVSIALPVAAPNLLQGLTTSVGFAFTGTQRAATNQ